MHTSAVISIHADGGPPWGRGFHVNYSSPPLNEVQAGPAVRPALTMKNALHGASLLVSNYLGSEGLYGRPDLAGPNLAQYPAVLVEMGNMRNMDDAAMMVSPDGRVRLAQAFSNGVLDYLRAGSPGQ